MLLRMHLKRAWFGKDLVGADAAAQAILGKLAANLDSDEAARLAAIYHSPRIRETPEAWNERTESLRKRLQEQN